MAACWWAAGFLARGVVDAVWHLLLDLGWEGLSDLVWDIGVTLRVVDLVAVACWVDALWKAVFCAGGGFLLGLRRDFRSCWVGGMGLVGGLRHDLVFYASWTLELSNI